MSRDRQIRDVDRDFVKVPKILQEEASIGPIPADQLIPWVVLAGISYLICEVFLSLGLKVFGLVSVWLIASWWLLTGKRSYKYTDLWILPNQDWIALPTFWVSAEDVGTFRRKQKRQPQAVSLKTPEGKTVKYKPFQLESNLHAQMKVEIGSHSFNCWLLCEGEDNWSAVIPFKFKGLHPQLYTEEVADCGLAISEALKEFPLDERIAFYMGCFRHSEPRLNRLDELANQCDLFPLSVLLKNEKLRIKELDDKGIRKFWSQYIFCTWTGGKTYKQKDSWSSKILRKLTSKMAKATRSFLGTQQAWENSRYCELARQIYENGYLPWKLLLETKANLQIEEFKEEELWHWLWYRFNDRTTTPPPIPQLVHIAETPNGLERKIAQTEEKDALSVALSGVRGLTSCPQHGGSRDKIYFNHAIAGVLVVEDPPSGWRNTRSQLQWQFERLSASYVYDTEVWVELESASHFLMQENLKKLAKQAESANRLVVEQGGGMDVIASAKQEESFEAQHKLYAGAKPIYCAPLYVVYRKTEEELDKACSLLCNSFGNANAIRETNIAWRLWVETLPINRLKMLCTTSPFTNRRINLDTDTAAGLIPLTRFRPVHDDGVEFICDRGGQPIYVDLFKNTERAIVTSASGGGKSILGFRFILEALARGIPVVGMDISTGGESTFATACKMLGHKAAFFKMSTESFNLVEPPDVRGLPPQEAAQKLNHWKQFLQQALVGIAMGKIDDAPLRERVEALFVKLINVFTSNPQIIDRYNAAFESGFGTQAWQRIPTLHDLLKFCTKEKLGLTSYEEIDRRAINQIVNQLSAKLEDPEIGHAIGRPSTIPPDPLMKIFALSGLNNENNAQIMALVASMACITNGLSHPRSLFVGDELSVLLGKFGFADMIGSLFATGRKDGISCLILAQDIEAIKNCSAAAQILQNTSIELVGRTTTAAAKSYVEVANFDRDIISKNATESFYPNSGEYFTRWLLKIGNRYWTPLRFYPGAMMLAAVANSEDEKAARLRFLKRYSSDELGILQGLKEFAKAYIAVLKGSASLHEIGRGDEG